MKQSDLWSRIGISLSFYLPHYAVHTPLQAEGDLEKKYKTKATFLADPKRAEFLTDLGRPVRQVQNQPTYASMIESMDEGVGRILEKIAALGLEKTPSSSSLPTTEDFPTQRDLPRPICLYALGKDGLTRVGFVSR